MPRPVSHRLVLGSVSAMAMVAMLGACSQPASFATVDLSGSYGSSSQTSQAFSPVTGQPVYQSVSLYGPQSFPDAAEYTPNAQLAYVDAPRDQVASLGPDTFGILGQQPSVPQYSSRLASPGFEQAELLGSPQFQQELRTVDQAFIDTGPLDAAPAPFAAPAPVAVQAPFIEAAPFEPQPFEPQPFESQPFESVDVAPFETAYVAPTLSDTIARSAPTRSIIEETALEPLPAPVAVPRPQVADDYATLQSHGAPETFAAPNAPAAPVTAERRRYQPWVAPKFGSVESDEQTEQVRRPQPSPSPAPVVQAPAAPAWAEPKPAGPDSDFTRAARDLLPPKPQEARIPAPTAVPPAAVLPAPRLGGGMTVPKASTGYPRPYELLRPGIWPELPNPGEGLVEAPTRTPLPQFAAAPVPEVQPTQPMALATERLSGTYQIQRGDTLLTIARQVGTTPEELAFENGMTPDAAIYIGQNLTIPARPARVVYHDGIPVIDAETADSVMGRAPIQRASIPTRPPETAVAAARFAWPVHGEVYHLDAGQVEIDPQGNAPVTASAAGKVAHVEGGPMGVLVVIEHDNGWRSLTVGLDSSEVSPGERVEQGATIGKASRDHRVRFELRDADSGVADALAQLRG